MELDNSADDLTSSQIVLTLAKELLGKGHTIYMDNWYSLPALFRELMNQTDVLGTAQLNRRNMPVKLKNKIARGQMVAYFSTNLMAVKWMDKKEVTFHKNEMAIGKTHRCEKLKPSAVVMYKKEGAVDVANQMLTTYPVESKRANI